MLITKVCCRGGSLDQCKATGTEAWRISVHCSSSPIQSTARIDLDSHASCAQEAQREGPKTMEVSEGFVQKADQESLPEREKGPGQTAGQECGICLENAAGIEVQGCGHALCTDCALQLCNLSSKTPVCPFCRCLMQGFRSSTGTNLSAEQGGICVHAV